MPHLATILITHVFSSPSTLTDTILRPFDLLLPYWPPADFLRVFDQALVELESEDRDTVARSVRIVRYLYMVSSRLGVDPLSDADLYVAVFGRLRPLLELPPDSPALVEILISLLDKTWIVLPDFVDWPRAFPGWARTGYLLFETLGRCFEYFEANEDFPAGFVRMIEMAAPFLFFALPMAEESSEFAEILARLSVRLFASASRHLQFERIAKWAIDCCGKTHPYRWDGEMLSQVLLVLFQAVCVDENKLNAFLENPVDIWWAAFDPAVSEGMRSLRSFALNRIGAVFDLQAHDCIAFFATWQGGSVAELEALMMICKSFLSRKEGSVAVEMGFQLLEIDGDGPLINWTRALLAADLLRFRNPKPESHVEALAGQSVALLDLCDDEGLYQVNFTVATSILLKLHACHISIDPAVIEFIDQNEPLCLDTSATALIGAIRASAAAPSEEDVNTALRKTCEALQALLDTNISPIPEEEASRLSAIVFERVGGLRELFRHPEISFDWEMLRFVVSGLMTLPVDDGFPMLEDFLPPVIPVVYRKSEEAFWGLVEVIGKYFKAMEAEELLHYIGDLGMIFRGLFADGFHDVPEAVRFGILEQAMIINLESCRPDGVGDLATWITFICRIVLSLGGTDSGPDSQQILIGLLNWVTGGSDCLPVRFAKLDLEMTLVILGCPMGFDVGKLIESIQRFAFFNYQRRLAIFTLRKVVEQDPGAGPINEVIANLTAGSMAPPDVVEAIMLDVESYCGYDEQPVPWNNDDIPDFESIDFEDLIPSN
jgi:hypothetical protein